MKIFNPNCVICLDHPGAFAFVNVVNNVYVKVVTLLLRMRRSVVFLEIITVFINKRLHMQHILSEKIA